MPEAGPHNQEYTQHHPNAITDRDKAEIMAHASEHSETMVGVKSDRSIRHLAEAAAASNKSDFKERDIQLSYANEYADMAARARSNADYEADEFGKLYDALKARAETVKSGLSGSDEGVVNPEKPPSPETQLN